MNQNTTIDNIETLPSLAPRPLPRPAKRTAKSDRIRPERNLEKWPGIWQPARANTKLENRILTRDLELADGRRVTAEVKVGFTGEGMLTTEDQKTYYALVKHWYESEASETHTSFSIRKLAKILQKKGWGTNVIESITNSLIRLRVTPFTWKNSYHDASTGETLEEIELFNILSDLKIIRRKSDGHITFEAGYYRFNDFITKNLLAKHTKPVMFDTILRFKTDIAQLLYSHVDLMLFGKAQYERKTAELFDDLGIRGVAYKNPSNRKQKLLAALKELHGVQLTSGWISEAMIERTKDGKDYKVVFRKSISAQELSAEPSSQQHHEPMAPVKDEMAQAAENLVQHFHSIFHGVRNHIPQSKELDQAVSLIAIYGVDEARYIVDFSRPTAEQTNYRPQTFGGIIQYASRAMAQFEEARQARERSRIARGRQAMEAAYEQYKDEILDRLIANLPLEEYDRMVGTYKAEMGKEGSFFEKYSDRPMFHDMARSAVRSDLRKTLDVVPFDHFCRQEAARILADYQIDPAELGIECIVAPVPEQDPDVNIEIPTDAVPS